MFSCSKDSKNMHVKGEIKGLMTGKLFLEKKEDSKLIAVDSIALDGDGKFELSCDINSPEMYYLSFNKDKNKRIMFFAEPTEITIYDNIEEFGWKPTIEGSKNQDLYKLYKKVDDQFKTKRLNFIAKDIEARAKKDTVEIKKLQQAYLRMVQQRTAYGIQFALNHKDFEVAPYIAMADLFDANFKYIDSINNSLTDKIKQSSYGKQLQEYVDAVKKEQLKK